MRWDGIPVKSRPWTWVLALMGLTLGLSNPPPVHSSECVDWVVLTLQQQAFTWLDYAYWYGLKYEWNPEDARRRYFQDGNRWREFVLDRAALMSIREMGLNPPAAETVDRALRAVGARVPGDADPKLLWKTLRDLLWLHRYRDRTFRYTLTIGLDAIQREYQKRRHKQPDLSLEEVYNDIYEALMAERLPRAFRRWQEEQLRRYVWRKLTPPDSCRVAPPSKPLPGEAHGRTGSRE